MYVIVGLGAAGASAAAELRRLDPGRPVVAVTAETDAFYSRIDLPDVIAGKLSPEDAERQGFGQFGDQGVVCRPGDPVVEVRPAEKTVVLASGDSLAYSKLLLATGSQPVIPKIPGAGALGVFTLWTMDDARQLAAQAAAAKRAVVVGAGLIGLKTALALRKRGIVVSVIERLPWLLPRQLDEAAARVVAAALAAEGIKVYAGYQVEEVETSRGQVCGVIVDGRPFPCEMAVMAVGVRPNTALAAAAGLKVERGIVVNEYLATSDKDIYAAGDAAEVRDLVTGEPIVPAIWPAAVEQGLAAARNMAGLGTVYDGAAAMNAVEIAGVPIVSVGEVNAAPGDDVAAAAGPGWYRKVIVRDGVLRGVICVGDIRQAGVLSGLCRKRAETGLAAAELLSPGFGFGRLTVISGSIRG